MTTRFLGLTWDHPRGVNALAAAAREIASPGLIGWDKQPLEGFESAPIGELAARYDILVLDHPHVGEAVALDCLQPLEDLFGVEEIAAWGADSVGPTLASYKWQGRHWALPLDVATQVMAYRPDRVPTPPLSWADVVSLSEHQPVALSLAGPHAALCFQSICTALGEAPGADEQFVNDAVAAEALEILARLHARAPVGSMALNPIGLLNAMSGSESISCVPLVFGYVNYARPGAGHRLAFANAPAGPGGARGSVLGGTGLAITKRVRPDTALLDHFRWLMSAEAQRGFIPEHDGQPSARQAWTDTAVNAAAGDFYRATFATTEGAYLRPRHHGAIAFQTETSRLVRAGLDGASIPDTLAAIRQAWRRSNPRLLSETPR